MDPSMIKILHVAQKEGNKNSEKHFLVFQLLKFFKAFYMLEKTDFTYFTRF